MLLRSAKDSGSATPTTARRGTRSELLDGRRGKKTTEDTEDTENPFHPFYPFHPMTIKKSDDAETAEKSSESDVRRKENNKSTLYSE